MKLNRNIENKIIKWISGKIKTAGLRGAVVGLSGGIDSAVVAVLCKKAVGNNNLLCLILPCETSARDLNDVQSVVKKFNLKTKTIDLTKTYHQFIKILPEAGRIAQGNLKTRLRMTTLYHFANKLKYIVVGTSNKTELMTGYFTKYGDGGVDILPIGNLLKRNVVELAIRLNIPRNIINKTPSAGLWKGQTDEGELGITYIELDKIIDKICNHKKISVSSKKIAKVKAMINKTCHKRSPSEIFIP